MNKIGNHISRQKSCEEIAEIVGMNYVDRGDGWDDEVLRLADCVMFDHHSVLQRPKRLAAEITAYLDDIVKNP